MNNNQALQIHRNVSSPSKFADNGDGGNQTVENNSSRRKKPGITLEVDTPIKELDSHLPSPSNTKGENENYSKSTNTPAKQKFGRQSPEKIGVPSTRSSQGFIKYTFKESGNKAPAMNDDTEYQLAKSYHLHAKKHSMPHTFRISSGSKPNLAFRKSHDRVLTSPEEEFSPGLQALLSTRVEKNKRAVTPREKDEQILRVYSSRRLSGSGKLLPLEKCASDGKSKPNALTTVRKTNTLASESEYQLVTPKSNKKASPKSKLLKVKGNKGNQALFKDINKSPFAQSSGFNYSLSKNNNSQH